MNLKQARDSYEFDVPTMKCYGLFVPTHFEPRPPFDGNDSNVYHIIHGTTNKGAPTILAEELIRRGDFTMRKGLMQCGYPSYGYYSAGEVAAKTVPFSNNVAELSRKILKIGKGTLPAMIAGIYTGRYPRSNQLAGGNEEPLYSAALGLFIMSLNIILFLPDCFCILLATYTYHFLRSS